MSRGVPRTALRVRGEHIAWLDELAPYTYAVPEALNPPDVFTRFSCGLDVEPRELHLALTEGRAAVSDDPQAVAVVETLVRRLENAFPAETRR